MPIIGFITGGVDFSNMYIQLSGAPAANLADARKAGATLAYGNFITLVINFIIVAFVLFLIVRAMNQMMKKPAPAPAARRLRRARRCFSKKSGTCWRDELNREVGRPTKTSKVGLLSDVTGRKPIMSSTIINIIIQIIAGIVGGNAAGSAMKNISLGATGNTIAGAVGGLGGGQILGALMPAIAGAAGGGLDVGSIVGQLVGGGVGGAILAAIVGLIQESYGLIRQRFSGSAREWKKQPRQRSIWRKERRSWQC